MTRATWLATGAACATGTGADVVCAVELTSGLVGVAVAGTCVAVEVEVEGAGVDGVEFVAEALAAASVVAPFSESAGDVPLACDESWGLLLLPVVDGAVATCGDAGMPPLGGVVVGVVVGGTTCGDGWAIPLGGVVVGVVGVVVGGTTCDDGGALSEHPEALEPPAPPLDELSEHPVLPEPLLEHPVPPLDQLDPPLDQFEPFDQPELFEQPDPPPGPPEPVLEHPEPPFDQLEPFDELELPEHPEPPEPPFDQPDPPDELEPWPLPLELAPPPWLPVEQAAAATALPPSTMQAETSAIGVRPRRSKFFNSASSVGDYINVITLDCAEGLVLSGCLSADGARGGLTTARE